MRRTLLALTAGFAIALTGACGTGTPSASDSKSPSVAASPSVASNTKEVCGQVEAKIQPMMTEVGKAIGFWVGLKQGGASAAQLKTAEDAAKAEIVKQAGELVKLAETANDPKVKADITKVADNMKASSDLKFLANVTGVTDMQEPLTKEVTAWVYPLALTCEMK